MEFLLKAHVSIRQIWNDLLYFIIVNVDIKVNKSSRKYFFSWHCRLTVEISEHVQKIEKAKDAPTALHYLFHFRSLL